MSLSLAQFLVAHVMIGLIGIFLIGGVVIGLMKGKLSVKMLKWFSSLSFLSFIISWITGGYYYVAYYGSQVKPVIKAGETPWVHIVIMETKEHIFIFLPFLAFVVMISIWLLGENLAQMPKLKRALTLVALIAFIIGISIALMGAVISGTAVS